MLKTIVVDTDKSPYAEAGIGDLCNLDCVVLIEDGDMITEGEKSTEAYNAVIDYVLGKGSMQEPMEFLRLWNEGDFNSLRKEWPDAPEEIYYADVLA